MWKKQNRIKGLLIAISYGLLLGSLAYVIALLESKYYVYNFDAYFFQNVLEITIFVTGFLVCGWLNYNGKIKEKKNDGPILSCPHCA